MNLVIGLVAVFLGIGVATTETPKVVEQPAK
jgi:hypothetical protein